MRRTTRLLSQIGWAIGCLLLGSLLSACEATPTPFPVDIPIEPTETPIPASERVIRYGLAANTRDQIMDLAELQAVAQVEYLNTVPNPQALGTEYDLIVAYGEWDGAQTAPSPLNISLIINLDLPPLDNPALADILQRGISPATLQGVLQNGDVPDSTDLQRELRTLLANAGYPDGFELRLAHHAVPGVQAIAQDLKAINIDLIFWALNQELWANEQAHIALVGWIDRPTRDEWIQAIANPITIDLISLPISYWVVDDLEIGFTANGFPIPRQVTE